MAVGSSAPRENVDLVLDLMDVGDLVKVRITGSDVSRGKPDPEVFSKAIDRIGVPAERCVVVEDAPAGIVAARQAGAKTVAVLAYQDAEAFEHPDLVVTDLASLSVERLRRLVQA